MGYVKYVSKHGFHNKTTTAQVMAKFGTNAKGKYVLVTGGSGGLGYETARVLAKAGAHVTVTCRTDAQGKQVVEKIAAEKPEGEIHYLLCDMSDLMSVKACCEKYLASNKPLHSLVLNAGIMGIPFSKSKQGFEMHLAVNHIGPFYMTTKFLPLMHQSGTMFNKSRVINVASSYNWLSAPPEAMFWDDLSGEKKYSKWPRYGQSKLAFVIAAVELNKRCVAQNLNVSAAALHPGIILETGLMRHNNLIVASGEQVPPLFLKPSKLWGFLMETFKNTAQGAATQTLMVVDPEFVPGEWYVDCNVTDRYLHPTAKDPQVGTRLWRVTEEMIQPYL